MISDTEEDGDGCPECPGCNDIELCLANEAVSHIHTSKELHDVRMELAALKDRLERIKQMSTKEEIIAFDAKEKQATNDAREEENAQRQTNAQLNKEETDDEWWEQERNSKWWEEAAQPQTNAQLNKEEMTRKRPRSVPQTLEEIKTNKKESIDAYKRFRQQGKKIKTCTKKTIGNLPASIQAEHTNVTTEETARFVKEWDVHMKKLIQEIS